MPFFHALHRNIHIDFGVVSLDFLIAYTRGLHHSVLPNKRGNDLPAKLFTRKEIFIYV
ncbi:fumarate hydratase [Prevotella intermedia ZT]|uniref:Fumarate hydratase n=1 Tax=Prevotella intermedia ZT TaxID=1347790 RepID=A0AAP0VMY7_PREIN|nr:fumarate hydratase [Prevotella intermedia ZT]